MDNKQCLFGNHAHQTWPLFSSHHHLSFPPPPTMLVTAANNTQHHYCPSWLPMNANDHQQPQRHHDQPKNEDSRPQTTTNTHPTNDGLDPWMDTGGDKPRWVNLPLLALHFVHTEYRCHVTVSDVAAKWWTTMLAISSFIVVVNLGHHSEYPPSRICPNSPRWDTGWWQPSTMTWHGRGTMMRTQDEDVAKTGGDKDMQQGQDNKDMWWQQHTATTIHGNNDTWQQQCTVTRQQQHFPFHITPTPLPLRSPSL